MCACRLQMPTPDFSPLPSLPQIPKASVLWVLCSASGQIAPTTGCGCGTGMPPDHRCPAPPPSAVQFRNLLQERLPSVRLPATLIFAQGPGGGAVPRPSLGKRSIPGRGMAVSCGRAPTASSLRAFHACPAHPPTVFQPRLPGSAHWAGTDSNGSGGQELMGSPWVLR